MKNHNQFIEKLFKIESEEERYRSLKEYMLSLNLEELMAWTKSDFKQLNDSLDKGITDEKRDKLLVQLNKFDNMISIKMNERKVA